MPSLNKRQSGTEGDQSKWFILTPGPNHPFTFQLEPEGYKWLLAAGLSHESDIDWDVFGTLRSLDLLYTLNSSYTPSDAPVPEDLSFEEIPVKERIRLAEGLLAKYSVTELSSQKGTLQFLLSIGDLDWECQQPVLEIILSGTPFTPSVMSGYDGEVYWSDFYDILSERNPILMALVCSVAYDTIEPMDDVMTINEGNPVWTYDDWVVCAGSELIFYEINDVVIDALPDLLRAEIAEMEGSRVTEGNYYSFFEREFAAISTFQFIMRVKELNPWLGNIISEGLGAEYPNSVLILPKRDTESNGPLKASDEPIL